MKDWIGPTELSKYLGLSRQTITGLCKRGELPAHKLNNRWLIDFKALSEAMVRVTKSSHKNVGVSKSLKTQGKQRGITTNTLREPISPPWCWAPGEIEARLQGIDWSREHEAQRSWWIKHLKKDEGE